MISTRRQSDNEAVRESGRKCTHLDGMSETCDSGIYSPWSSQLRDGMAWVRLQKQLQTHGTDERRSATRWTETGWWLCARGSPARDRHGAQNCAEDGENGLRRGRRLSRPQLCSCLAQQARPFIFRALMRFQSRDEITLYDFGPWDDIMVKSDRMNSLLVCEIIPCMNSA